VKNLLQKNGRELNALFIQSTLDCGHNCVKCYALAHQIDNQLHAIELINLFSVFYNSRDYWANQITVSIDKLNNDIIKRQHMLLIIQGIFDILNKDSRRKNEKPSVSFTVHSIEDLKEYFEIEDCNLDWSKVDSIAFSTLKPRDFVTDFLFDIIKKAGVKITHNLLAYSQEQVVRDIRISQDFVDNIHLVMFKNLADSKEQALETLKKYRDIIFHLQKEQLNSKVSIDRCYNASMSKIGCSAGASLMQVWPDGSISGCPYMKKSETKKADNYLKILGNIKDRQFQNYESNCIYKEAI
jgi:hypothetical protein